jgi:hypothetical protein
MKKRGFVFMSIANILLCISCASGVYEKGVVFFANRPSGRVWIGREEMDIQIIRNEEGRNSYIQIFFDDRTSKVWALSYSKDYDYLYFADISNGIYDAGNEICIKSIDNKLHTPTAFIYNNKALILYKRNFYGLLNLLTTEQEALDLQDILISKETGGIIGYNEKSILYHNGCYTILNNEYSRYNNKTLLRLRYKRFISNEYQFMGFNGNNYIVMYEPESRKYIQTPLKREKYNPTNTYEANELYYRDGNIIFMSEDSLSNSFSFLKNPARRNWYKYNLEITLIKKRKIFSPSPYAIILGIMK